jgi:hypothetical protein
VAVPDKRLHIPITFDGALVVLGYGITHIKHQRTQRGRWNSSACLHRVVPA